MGVSQVRGGLDFSQETLGTHDGGEFRFLDLERDLALVLQVVGQVDRRHATFAKLMLYAVAALQGDVEADGWIGHAGQDASKACGAARISDT